MPSLWGALAYFALLVGMTAATHGGAVFTARALGVRDFRWLDVKPASASLARRGAIRCVSALCPLALCVLLGWLGTLLVGQLSATTRVRVMAGPAQEAGMADGDRIVSIDGEPIVDWPSIQLFVRRGAAEKRLEITRDGAARTLLVTRRNGRIGVQPIYRRDAILPLPALAQAVNLPYAALGSILGSVSHERHVDLLGPSSIVRETRELASAGSLCLFLASLGAYFWLSVIGWHLFEGLSLELFRRTHPSASAEPALAWRLARLQQALAVLLLCTGLHLPLAMLARALADNGWLMPLVMLTMPFAVALYAAIWLAGFALRRRALAALLTALSLLVPGVILVAGVWLLLAVRQRLIDEGFRPGWFVVRPAQSPPA